MITTQVGVDPDTGRPVYNHRLEDSDGEFQLVVTGAGQGLVKLADGTLYDVTPPAVLVASAAHASEVAHHIAVQVEASGVLDRVDPGSGELIRWEHTDCDHCDAPKSDGSHSAAAKAQVAAAKASVKGGRR